MNRRDAEELADLVAALCEGELADEQAARLEQLVCETPEARDEYLDFMALHADLHRNFAGYAAAAPQPAAPAKAAVKAASPAARAGNWLFRYWNQPTPFAFLVAVVTTVSLLLTAAQVRMHWNSARNEPRAAAPVLAPFVGSVAGAVDAHWADSKQAVFDGAHLRAGQVVELLAGVAEIRFQSDARVILKGPARLSMLSDNEAYLHLGQLTAQVPPRANGFSIATPEALIVDRGTEFAVEVAPHGATEIHVFAGLVETRWLNLETPATAELRGGEATQLDPQTQKLARFAAQQRRFTRQLPVREASVRDGLIHHWTFNDGDARDQVGGAHGKLFGGARIEQGRLQLDGVDGRLEAEPLGSTLHEYTLAAWVAVENLRQRSGGVLILEKPEGADVFDGLVFAEKKPQVWINGSDGHQRSLLDSDYAVIETELRSVLIAAVFRFDRVALYRDGQICGEVEASILTYGPPDSRVLMGLRHSDLVDRTGTPTGGDGYFAGAIDEARIYDRALTQEELRQLTIAGPVGSPPTLPEASSSSSTSHN